VRHPLAGNARGVRVEQAVFQVLAGVPVFLGPVADDVAVPVHVFAPDFGHQFGAAPAAGLVHVPGHFHHRNVAELAVLDELVGGVVVGGAAALRTHLHDLAGFFHGLEGDAGVFHGFGKGLFHVHVLAHPHGVGQVQGVLEVGRADDDGVRILLFVEFVVVAGFEELLGQPAFFLQVGFGLVAAAAPDVGHGHDFEVHPLGVVHEAGQQ
jgi:hypothetical protein